MPAKSALRTCCAVVRELARAFALKICNRRVSARDVFEQRTATRSRLFSFLSRSYRILQSMLIIFVQLLSFIFVIYLRLGSCLTQKDTETLVHAFITSKLDNCNSLLVGLPQYSLEKLPRVHNATARLVSRTLQYDRITPVLIDLHWRPVKQRISFKILLLTYKALNAIAPQYI